MFIPSIDAMWCECLIFFYKIGFSSFSTRSIVRGLKFERNEFHVFNRPTNWKICSYRISLWSNAHDTDHE